MSYRLKAFEETADKLIAANHYDSKYVDDRRRGVIERRNRVKDAANKRRNGLNASHSFQNFAADVDDLSTWMDDKSKTASDESYRDLNNLERKLQKHEAFERELHANEGQLRSVNKVSWHWDLRLCSLCENHGSWVFKTQNYYFKIKLISSVLNASCFITSYYIPRL